MKIHLTMKGNYLLIALITILSCQNASQNKNHQPIAQNDSISKPKNDSAWYTFPKPKLLSEYKSTEFVTTLSDPIHPDFNTIYAPAFLYVWDELENALKIPILFKSDYSNQLKNILKSNDHLNALQSNEYSSSYEIKDDYIIAKAFFNKTLPFTTVMQEIDHPLMFNNIDSISCFGMQEFDSDIAKEFEILYYKDDQHFVLKIIPKEMDNEIILSVGIGSSKNLNDLLKKQNVLIKLGKTERTKSKNKWKYELLMEDNIIIPKIKFNIATNYNQLEGQNFQLKSGDLCEIKEAYQRTGLILSQEGAAVESLALTVVEIPAAPEPSEIKPKNFVFDQPFVVVIKHTNQKHPYFVMTVNNAELLAKP